MSYSGGDGQTLGIVLTPKHITELFCRFIRFEKDRCNIRSMLWYCWLFDISNA